jgi:hypothetical protein
MGISYKRSGARYDRNHQDRVRQKIADSNVVLRLTRAFNGEIELSQSQVAIGLAFLKKLVPDLQSQQVELTETAPFAVIPEQMRDQKAWESTFVPTSPDVAPPATKATKAASSSTKH